MKLEKWFMPLCILAMLIIGGILYPSLPEELPRQWGFGGEINATWHKLYAVLFPPAIAALVWILTYFLPKIDPHGEQYEKFAPSYLRVRQAIVAFLLGMQIITLTQYDNPQMIVRLILFAISLLLVLIGNEMGRFRQTWFLGIRSPWTLADERVWRMTHRLGARLYVIVGLLNMFTALVLPIPIAGTIYIVTVLGVSFGAIVYSYFAWRQVQTAS